MSSRRRAVASLVLIAATILTLAMHSGGVVTSVLADDASVSIEDFAYTPATATISAGSVVTWNNRASRPHTVTSDTNTFDSGPIGVGEAFANLFDRPGTYAYHCSIHPEQMRGAIVVTAAAPTTLAGTPEPAPPAGTRPPDPGSPSTGGAPTAAVPAASGGVNVGDGGASNGPGLAALVVVTGVLVALILVVTARRRRPPRV